MESPIDYLILKKANLNREEAKYLWSGFEHDFFIESFLKYCDWHTWYSDNYWVNRSIVADNKKQDHTDYGMDIKNAFMFEATNCEKIEPQYFNLP